MRNRILRTCWLMLAVALMLVSTAKAQTSCSVGYSITSTWSGGFNGGITIYNTGTTAISSWTLTFPFANGQVVSTSWNSTWSQSGANVTLNNVSYNGSIAAGTSISGIGFTASAGSTNAAPTSYSLNGVACSIAPTTGTFTLAGPSSVTIQQGQYNGGWVNINGSGGFNGTVSFSLTGLPSGATVGYSANPASGGTWLEFFAPTTLATGSYPLTVKGTSGSLSATTTFNLVVQPVANVTVNVNTLSNRHAISPYIYGGNPSQGTAQAADLGMTFVRYGGNQSSNYNWKLHTYNTGNDWYFESGSLGDSNGGTFVSENFITEYQNVGSHPLVTMPMLNWVAQASGHSYPVSQFGTQCKADPYNSDAGNGLQTDCSTWVSNSPETSAYYPLVDTPSQCPTGTTDGTTCLDRQTWAQALATAFGGPGWCPVPYSQITSCHFYDMDNEVDIWNGTHHDVHPIPPGYNELANTFVAEAGALKTWDSSAVRFGPVACCWWFYWNNGPAGDNKAAHAGLDFMPWWLNHVYWLDQINGTRTLDVFDIHAYPGLNNNSSLTVAQNQAAAATAYRDYWDPTYTSSGIQASAPSQQTNPSIPFRIPRMKALVNTIYPGTPLSFTEWSDAIISESDFSTALGDADAWGVMGREGVSFASRWGTPTSGNPNYYAFKLYNNYDGNHHGFGTISVSDTNNADVNSFASYAAINSAGTQMTIMVINRDPAKTEQVNFNLSGFSPSTYTTYTVSNASPTTIQASSSQSWNATQSFAPYSITMVVINGSSTSTPATQWYVNPDDLMVPAGATAVLHPSNYSGTTNVTVTSAVFDAFEGMAACNGSMNITSNTIYQYWPASINVTAPTTPGFCHYTVTGNDGTATMTQGGWIIVGNPPATMTTSGSGQSAARGTTLSQPLTITLNAGQSGGTSSGAGVFFTTSAGTISNGTSSGSKVIATTNSSGIASVTLTLPSTPGTVTVTAQTEQGLGGASVTFTETAQ